MTDYFWGPLQIGGNVFFVPLGISPCREKCVKIGFSHATEWKEDMVGYRLSIIIVDDVGYIWNTCMMIVIEAPTVCLVLE